MRNVFVCLALGASVFTLSPAVAQTVSARHVLEPSAREAERQKKALDELFDSLKRQRNQVEAERTAARIGAAFGQSGSASIDLMMGWAAKALTDKKFDLALDYLDQVIALKPGYAEAYNRRATVHFAMQNYSKSMADIERTITLEPRHFGALSGLAQIMDNTGREELALRAYERVLDVYPALRSAQDEVGRLADKLAGDGA
ncbi:tetratricopeptide repeat protein [Tianweitania sp.]|uniref:tetratricopeptide repeat protein n=1 Tax=Tianweitania sp. TaxID=2021634 RepID=UPI0028A23467|nr:tetratricopeptide repeat protein [Tianweitania sp.]